MLATRKISENSRLASKKSDRTRLRTALAHCAFDMQVTLVLCVLAVVAATRPVLTADQNEKDQWDLLMPAGLLDGVEVVLSTAERGPQFSKHLGFYTYRNNCFLRTNKRVTFEIEGIGPFRFRLKSTYRGRFGQNLDRFKGKYIRMKGDAVTMATRGTEWVAVATEDPLQFYLRAAHAPIYVGHYKDSKTLRLFDEKHAPFYVEFIEN